MALWIELQYELERVYDQQPPNAEMIHQIYDCAQWYLHESRDNDLFTAVVYGFYEHVLTHEKVRQGLPNHMSRMDFLGLNGYLAYHLTEPEFKRCQKEFLAAKDKPMQKTGYVRKS